MINSRALCLLASALFSCSIAAQSSANQRWFEIEVIAFSQTPDAGLQERFADSVTPIKPGRAYDLLTPRYQPDISKLLTNLPLCLQAQPGASTDSFVAPFAETLCILEQQPPAWQHKSLFEPKVLNKTVPYPSHLPSQVTGVGEHKNEPYIAEPEALQLTDIAQKINRQAGKQVLLHTVWRQAPVTERLAIASRWYSGNNYSDVFNYWGQPLATDDSATAVLTEQNDTELDNTTPAHNTDMLQHIAQLLQQFSVNGTLPQPDNTVDVIDNPDANNDIMLSALPQQVWQLDGLFKLHLDHYLFVNTAFNLRLPEDTKLRTIYVQQSRRVISGEIHYLDHPYLGVVLQIRRYEPPADETDTETQEATVTANLP